jgi:diguanylate cyclase (GGDEF)-like protein
VTRTKATSIAALSALAVAFVGYVALPLDGAVRQWWYNSAAVIALAVGLLGMRMHRPVHWRGWGLILAGFAGWVVGDLVWSVESAFYRSHYPAPSDCVYLASYVFLASGVLVTVRTRRSTSDRAAVLDAGILSTAAAVPVAVFVIAPLAGDQGLTLAARVISGAYPVCDIFLVAALSRMLTSPGARNASYRLLAAATVAVAVADAAWNLLVVLSGDASADNRWLNAVWLAGYLLAAAAAVVPSMTVVAEPAPEAESAPFGRRRVAALGTGLLLPTGVLVVDGALGGSVNWPVIGVGAALMSGLVFARFLDLLSVVQQQSLQLAALARSDPLTGAPNRRSWDFELSRACRDAVEQSGALALAILDLDHFKAYNDAHGHQAGDRLLREAVASWTDALPREAMLARYGGEEFAVLLPGHTLASAVAAVERLQAATPFGQSFSAGVAAVSAGRTPHALVAAADEALYRAKRAGRNRVLPEADRDPAQVAVS